MTTITENPYGVTTTHSEVEEIMGIVECVECQGGDSYFSLRSPLGGLLTVSVADEVVEAAWAAAGQSEDDPAIGEWVVRFTGISYSPDHEVAFSKLMAAGWNAQAAFDRLADGDDCSAEADEVEFVIAPASPE